MAKLETKDFALGIQHLLAMFGATVLVPLITGLSPAVALLTAGLGTLLFHLCTKGMVPVFLGSSFAFIPALCAVIGGDSANIPLAQGGVIVAGLLYVIFAAITKIIGPDFIRKIFPPVVTGPVIIIIGLSLTGPAIKDVLNIWDGNINLNTVGNAAIAIFTFSIMAIGMNRSKGFWKLIPILVAVLCGYALCVILHFCGLFKMDFSAIANAPWVNIPYKTPGFLSVPKFALMPILTIAPVAIVTFMEHIGDITTNGAVVGKDFFKEPGLHRTLLGDGLATALAGFFGGPSNTTYSENTGVLATTGNYNPAVLRLAAYFAILLAFFGKFGAFLQTIPVPVKGGIELMLFGMIAAIGIRTIVEAKLDMTNNRNLCIMAATLCSGIGLVIIGGLPLKIGGVDVNLSALFIATIIGVLMNLLIPQKKD
ncbi:MAG: uracil-xanthine permease [Victivallales bacterium]|nr:uracil-xanthine permease [Victivallales bacterium]